MNHCPGVRPLRTSAPPGSAPALNICQNGHAVRLAATFASRRSVLSEAQQLPELRDVSSRPNYERDRDPLAASQSASGSVSGILENVDSRDRVGAKFVK